MSQIDRSTDISKFKFYLWVGIAFFVLYFFHDLANNDAGFLINFLNNIWRICYLVVLNFIFFELAIPFVLRKREYLIYNILLGILVLWIFLMFWSYGLYSWRRLGIALHIYTPINPFKSLAIAIENQMGISAGSVFFFGIIRHIYNYFKLKQATQQLRIEKKEAELGYLKSQTNPHFLFNTLNNIYALTKEKSDLAPESVMRLSKMLRFMLYETGGQYIAIEQEVKIINDYIELEKLRYDESLQVTFNNDIEDMKQSLPPLLLIPLVENAFKHGVSETRNYPFVDIHLSVKQKQLLFVVKNSMEGTAETSKEKIGLTNLKRQLELQFKDYSLNVQQNGSVFTATLKINLSSHV